MNKELIDALNALEKEKEISKDTLIEAIENSLLTACKNHFGKADNFNVTINRETGDFKVVAEKEVVDVVEDNVTQISLANAKMIDARFDIGDIVHEEVKSKDFGRIAIQVAKNVILQKIREEEKNQLFNQYAGKERQIVTGTVQRFAGRNVIVNLGKVDATLNESEMVEGESYSINDRIRVYVVEVKSGNKGPRIVLSRTHPELVKKLFEAEVSEIADGTVEIMAVAREAGSRTKIAVLSHDPDVDAVGACVGLNGARVNAVVDELNGEKIDIVNWNDNAAYLIENALSPAKVVSVIANEDEKTARVVVPDYQLSLAIGMKGQNARLAAKLTGFKIDIKSESQMKELGEDYINPYDDYEQDEDDYEDDYYDDDDSNEAFEE